MKNKKLPAVFGTMMIMAIALSSFSPEPAIQYVLRIDKTQIITDFLRQHGEIRVIQDMNTCYLGIADEEIAARLDARHIPYKVLDHMREPVAGLFLVNLPDLTQVRVLKRYGIAIPVEGNNIFFRCLDPRHPSRFLSRIYRGIKKIGAPVQIGPSPTPAAGMEAVRASRTINNTILEMTGAVKKENLEQNIRTLQNFTTRDAVTQGCKRAGDFLIDTLRQTGIQVEEDPFNFEGYDTRNIIGRLPGKTNPSSVVIISAHYDSYAEPDSETWAPGADDNASGTAAVLEAARIMSRYSFAYSIKFILFSAEEWGLYGSAHYAKEAARDGEKIVGVINLDMVAYADSLPEDLDIIVNSNSRWLGKIVKTAARDYSGLAAIDTVDNSYDYSDHSSFWDRGFAAVLCIEDYEDTNPYYHTRGDTLSTLNLNFATAVTRACLASTALLALTGNTPGLGITVTAPNGGERWAIGGFQNITWTSTSVVANVKISYSIDNGASWVTIVSSIPNNGTYTWAIPGTVSSRCRVKISRAADGNPADTSNGVFSIIPGKVPRVPPEQKK